MELDRPCAEEGTNRRLRCDPRVDSGGKMEERPPQNNIATHGGGGAGRGRLELLECGALCSLRPTQ